MVLIRIIRTRCRSYAVHCIRSRSETPIQKNGICDSAKSKRSTTLSVCRKFGTYSVYIPGECHVRMSVRLSAVCVLSSDHDRDFITIIAQPTCSCKLFWYPAVGYLGVCDRPLRHSTLSFNRVGYFHLSASGGLVPNGCNLTMANPLS